jgi:hypothetical protein
MLQEQISQVRGLQYSQEGWRVFFAGDPEIIEELARNAYIEERDFVYNLNGDFIKDVCKKISDQNAQYDAVVFYTQPQDVVAFRKKGFSFENRFYPPLIYFSEIPIESKKRLLNVWHIDQKGKDIIFLKQELVENIKAGKQFVEYVKKAALLIMTNNPQEYQDLKQRNPNNVYIIPPTEEGYEEAKAYLESRDIAAGGKIIHGKDVLVGGVAVDEIGGLQARLLVRLDNESLCRGIPFAYIGRTYSVYAGQFERCRTIPGEEIKQKGLMRLLEDFNPNAKEIKTEIRVTRMRHDETFSKEGYRIKTAVFGDVDPNAETQSVPILEADTHEVFSAEDRAEFLKKIEEWTSEGNTEQTTLSPANKESLIRMGADADEINSEDVQPEPEDEEEKDIMAKMNEIEAANTAKGNQHEPEKDLITEIAEIEAANTARGHAPENFYDLLEKLGGDEGDDNKGV